MSPLPEEDDHRSVLSWESVLDSVNTDPNPAQPAPVDAPPAAPEIELTIPPLSLDPLSLAPLPPIPEGSAQRSGAGPEQQDVLGDLHLEIPPLDLAGPPSSAPPPATAPAAAPAAAPSAAPAPAPTSAAPSDVDQREAPALEMIELKIAPLDVPHGPPSDEIAAVIADDLPSLSPAPTALHAPTVGSDIAEHPEAAPRTHASVPGLPTDPVAEDSAPTTVITGVVDDQVPTPVVPADVATGPPTSDVSTPSVPTFPPNHVDQARPAVADRPSAVPTPAPGPDTVKVSRKDRKHQAQLKKHQQKQALQAAKDRAKSQRSGGGLALFLTLLVLAGLIAGAIVFGQPYLFPDEWDEASRPYAEAVEVARGNEIAEPMLVQRRAEDAFAVSMAGHVIGSWEDDMATWRSLGLVSGVVDAPLLGELVTEWAAAYYSPSTGEVIANDAAPVAALDAAITEAMAAAALDQENGWSTSIEEPMLDATALTRGAVVASNRAAADATGFGAADLSMRDVGVSTFLPPILEYRVNAPDAYAEFALDNAPALEALAAASRLQPSTEPELVDGETLVSAQQLTDRTFWYMVFASYTDAPTAYAASNALVQASLATADAAGTQCSYGTFSGTDVDGTARVADVLQQWAANVPAEMNAGFSTLPNGSMQLRSCDPGAGAASGARFGVGREITRLRSVELAAITALPTTADVAIDRGAIIDAVRTSAIGLTMVDIAFDVTWAESAARARSIVAASPPAAVTGE